MTSTFAVLSWERNERKLTVILSIIRHLPTLIRLDREARREGRSMAERHADFWGNLGALEAARTGAWS